MQAATRLSFICASLFVAVVTLGARAAPEPWYREARREETVTVTKVDPQTRLLSLRDDQGRTTTVHAGPDIRNFDQIKVDDRVVVTYRAAVAASIAAPSEGTKGVTGAVTLTRAEAGQQPHGELTASLTTTVRVESVDTAHNTITFYRDDGEVRTVDVQDEKAREFIRGLKKGDLVTVTYSEAVALSIRPAPRTDEAH